LLRIDRQVVAEAVVDEAVAIVVTAVSVEIVLTVVSAEIVVTGLIVVTSVAVAVAAVTEHVAIVSEAHAAVVEALFLMSTTRRRSQAWAHRKSTAIWHRIKSFKFQPLKAKDVVSGALGKMMWSS